MQSRRPSGLAIAPPPLTHRRSSLLSLDTAASPHTPRSCASTLPVPDLYLQPTVSKRTSTTSWNSSNADEMDFDWKQDQVLLLSRTLDALPAHLVTPFNGPIPPSNLLDKIARGVSQAKGPLDWPHSIRATRVKLIELARARAKDDAKKKEQPHLLPKVVDADPSSRYDYFDGPHHTPIPSDDVPQRRPLYKQSSMDFIKPSPTEIKDNPTIAQLSNRLQRTDRSFPNPATYHPYKPASRIAVRSRTAANGSQASSAGRSSSPPAASDVPDLIVPNPNSLSNSSSNSSFDSVPPPSAMRPQFIRRSASTLSSSSMYSSSSNGSSGMALQDKRLQRVRRSDSFGAPLNAPTPPPKDYPTRQPVVVGMKRAPSYGALAQGARQEGKLKSERQVQENAFLRAMKDVIEQEEGGNSSATSEGKAKKREAEKDKENDDQMLQQKHGRQLSGSYPSSDEEEKARGKRAKKLRAASGAKSGSPGGVVPPSPSIASLSSSTSGESLSASINMPISMPTTPMVVQITTAPSTPTAGARALSPPPAKERVLASPKTPRTPKSPPTSSSKLPTFKTRALLKPAPTVIIGSPERVRSPTGEVKETKGKTRKPYLYSVPETGKDAAANNNISGNAINNNNAAPTSSTNKRPSAPKMNAQRNPSMFGMELPRLSALSSSVASLLPSATASATTSSSSSASSSKPATHKRTLSRESTTTNGSGSSSMRLSTAGVIPPLCGDAALSVPPSPLTMGFTQDVGMGMGVRRPTKHVKRASADSSSSTRALSPPPILSTASAITADPIHLRSSIATTAASITNAPALINPTSPQQRVKTLRRVRNRLAPTMAIQRKISFGSLLESTDDMGMDVDSYLGGDEDRDDRSFDLSGGRVGMGMGMGLGLSFGALDGGRMEKERDGADARGSGGASGSGSVFGAVLGEAFSVKPRAVPDRTPKRERDRPSKEHKERGLLGSAFKMA